MSDNSGGMNQYSIWNKMQNLTGIKISYHRDSCSAYIKANKIKNAILRMEKDYMVLHGLWMEPTEKWSYEKNRFWKYSAPTIKEVADYCNIKEKEITDEHIRTYLVHHFADQLKIMEMANDTILGLYISMEEDGIGMLLIGLGKLKSIV